MADARQRMQIIDNSDQAARQAVIGDQVTASGNNDQETVQITDARQQMQITDNG